jgi:hypothetical protein
MAEIAPVPASEPPSDGSAVAERDDEIRQLLEARNHRRVRAGKPPLEVDAAIEREITALGGLQPLRCRAMADPRRFELEELVNRPGTYFNPQTEVLVVVDDSPELDAEIFNMEEFEGADWVLISDEVAVDEDRRDELLQTFQTHHAPDDTGDELEEDSEEYDEEQEDLGRD